MIVDAIYLLPKCGPSRCRKVCAGKGEVFLRCLPQPEDVGIDKCDCYIPWSCFTFIFFFSFFLYTFPFITFIKLCAKTNSKLSSNFRKLKQKTFFKIKNILKKWKTNINLFSRRSSSFSFSFFRIVKITCCFFFFLLNKVKFVLNLEKQNYNSKVAVWRWKRKWRRQYTHYFNGKKVSEEIFHATFYF